MRIISGTHKGRRIQVGNKFKARPTTDIAKETLFNILNNLYDFEKLEILDLFSGTGSISYEFASRGAKKVISIEKDYKHHTYIRTNIEHLGFANTIIPIKSDSFRFLEQTSLVFDIIFADPPFEMENLNELPNLVMNKEILTKIGLFILEHPKTYDFSEHPHFERLVKKGSVHFSFFS